MMIYALANKFLVYLLWVNNNHLAYCLNIASSWTFVSSSSTKSMDQVHVSVPRPRSLHIDCTALLSQPCPLYLDTGRPETASRNLKYIMYRYILLVSKHSHTSLVLYTGNIYVS